MEAAPTIEEIRFFWVGKVSNGRTISRESLPRIVPLNPTPLLQITEDCKPMVLPAASRPAIHLALKPNNSPGKFGQNQSRTLPPE